VRRSRTAVERLAKSRGEGLRRHAPCPSGEAICEICHLLPVSARAGIRLSRPVLPPPPFRFDVSILCSRFNVVQYTMLIGVMSLCRMLHDRIIAADTASLYLLALRHVPADQDACNRRAVILRADSYSPRQWEMQHPNAVGVSLFKTQHDRTRTNCEARASLEAVVLSLQESQPSGPEPSKTAMLNDCATRLQRKPASARQRQSRCGFHVCLSHSHASSCSFWSPMANHLLHTSRATVAGASRSGR